VTAEAPARAGGAAPSDRARDPGRVLRFALLAWGTGHAALGLRRTGWILLGAELIALLAVAVLHVALATTTLAVVPFGAGTAFIAAWGAQAIHAYRLARARQQAIGPAEPGSAVMAIAWLGLPLLVWWSFFWLEAGSASSPAAVLDRFLRDAPAIAAGDEAAAGSVAIDAAGLMRSTQDAVDALRDDCPSEACRAGTPRTLLHGARVRLASQDGDAARAIVESVHYERRETSFLGIFPGSELVPVPDHRLLVLELEARDAPGMGMNVGARRWVIIDSRSSRAGA
jgi:hypothetical protein